MEIMIDKQTIDKITGELNKDNGNKIKAGYLTGRTESDKIIIEGVYVPEQISNEGSTTISSEEILKAFTNIENQRKFIIGFAQYNGSFPVYESATTRVSRKRLAQTKKIHNLGLVVNQKGDYKIFQ
ncbi:MAG: hypothetical protein KKF74_03470 [Nanoarchaeota archaeon]|nr:hypothetical protein [Nanoarchaeota archaeon]